MSEYLAARRAEFIPPPISELSATRSRRAWGAVPGLASSSQQSRRSKADHGQARWLGQYDFRVRRCRRESADPIRPAAVGPGADDHAKVVAIDLSIAIDVAVEPAVGGDAGAVVAQADD